MRKLVLGGLLLFAAYFLVTNPEGAAGVVEQSWDVLTNVFEGMLDFISELFS